MDLGVGLELRIVRLVVTLGFFWTVIMTVVTLQGDRAAWGYGVGALFLGFAMGWLWKDDLVAAGNAREQQKGADIRAQEQGGITWVASPNPAPQPPTQALPSGPSSPIQHSG